MRSWDIFCSIVDNFGDIGVSWRLTRQLQHELNQSVRIFVDDLEVFSRLCQEIDPNLQEQQLQGIRICHWSLASQAHPADVVIETFGCHIPESYREAMGARATTSVWLNLEYLSAEEWVDNCHLLPSPQLLGPAKVFYFPGFTEKTGGLLRETDLIKQREGFSEELRLQFLESLDVHLSEHCLLISVFSYRQPAIASWLDPLVKSATRTHLLVSPGPIEQDLCDWLAIDSLETGRVYTRGNLGVQKIPFLSQDQYDRLLWSCDLNIVRGEDSFVRAQWAAKPFIWHIYPQQDDIHLVKLDAFMTRYMQEWDPQVAAVLRAVWYAWNRKEQSPDGWRWWTQNRPQLEQYALGWCDEQSSRKSLAKLLAEFVQNC